MITSLQAFKESLQHNKELYRSTSQHWLITLLTNGSIRHDGDYPHSKKEWIALSQDYNSGGQDHYGNCHITFNEEMLYQQGAIEIDYEDIEFWNQFPTIAKHVSGTSNADEYYKDRGYSGPEEAHQKHDLTWEQNLEGYYEEEEVVIEEIKYEPGLIILVTFNEKPQSKLIKLLQKFNIKYTIN